MAKIRETTELSVTAIASTIRSIAGAVLAGYLALIVTADNFLWYLAPILLAPVSSMTILAVPHVLLQWFPGRSGTAAGIAMTFSGL